MEAAARGCPARRPELSLGLGGSPDRAPVLRDESQPLHPWQTLHKSPSHFLSFSVPRPYPAPKRHHELAALTPELLGTCLYHSLHHSEP